MAEGSSRGYSYRRTNEGAPYKKGGEESKSEGPGRGSLTYSHPLIRALRTGNLLTSASTVSVYSK